ncbi:hypothetical protein SLU01_24690 [Sporosarcina luteola]|uniref:Uncharacterized protein n=1 Tax=Sporosarcina luteola TaxID=582850 RepID=A0A511Z9M0_9BACL|nr:hypothetical protein [Sporosarcina luteola]GEN84157.1 hypothetical protein SLU01_24690 [Sporosarcina luteola]
MKKKLSVLLLAALFASFAGAGSAMAMEPNDNVDASAIGRENFAPPQILPPQV